PAEVCKAFTNANQRLLRDVFTQTVRHSARCQHAPQSAQDDSSEVTVRRISGWTIARESPDPFVVAAGASAGAARGGLRGHAPDSSTSASRRCEQQVHEGEDEVMTADLTFPDTQ